MNTKTQEPGTTPAAAPAANTSKRKKLLLTIGGIFAAVGIGYGVYWTVSGRYFEETEDAYVQGNVVQITPQIAGTISRIFVDDTDVVKAGQPLVSLDTADADIALAQAEAELARTVREVRTLYASQAQSSANLALRKSELARAEDDLATRKKLAGSGAVSGEEIRHAQNTVATAKAAVGVAYEQFVSGSAMTEGTNVTQHPTVQRAAAKVQEAMLAQSRSTLYAPIGGQIAKRAAQIGQRINPGAPLMAIVPLDQLWVDANFKESQLRDMRIGQPVTLTADVYGGKVRYEGRITGLAAGTGSAFALLPAQNATGNWIKVVQRVPVRIALDPKKLAEHPLRVGLSMQAEVDLHDKGGAHVGDRTASSATASYIAAANPIEKQFSKRIDTIIASNLR